MNKGALTIWLLLVSLGMKGQMFPLSDEYVHNPLMINPAYCGSLGALSTSLSYRNQWTGFENAPKSQVMSVHAPVHNDRIGLGLVVDHNTVGIFRETGIFGNYAYRRELAHGILAMGLGFGITWHQSAWNDLVAVDPDDAELLTNPTSYILPNFSLGAWYYTDNFYLGISMPRFLGHSEDPSSGKATVKANLSEFNYLFMGGTTFDLTPYFSLNPSILVKAIPNHDFQADFYLQAGVVKRIYAGLGYRTGRTLIGMLNLQLNGQLQLAYAYDYNLGGMSRIRNGSHEFSLRYTFSYTRKVPDPRQF